MRLFIWWKWHTNVKSSYRSKKSEQQWAETNCFWLNDKNAVHSFQLPDILFLHFIYTIFDASKLLFWQFVCVVKCCSAARLIFKQKELKIQFILNFKSFFFWYFTKNLIFMLSAQAFTEQSPRKNDFFSFHIATEKLKLEIPIPIHCEHILNKNNFFDDFSYFYLSTHTNRGHWLICESGILSAF